MLLSPGTILIVELPLALYLSSTPRSASAASGGPMRRALRPMLIVQASYYWFFWKNKPIKKLISDRASIQSTAKGDDLARLDKGLTGRRRWCRVCLCRSRRKSSTIVAK